MHKTWLTFGALGNVILKFYILVTVLLGIIPINNQLDAQFLIYINIYINKYI